MRGGNLLLNCLRSGWTSFLLFNSTFSSSAPTGASREIKEKFGVSTMANVLVVSGAV
jgi:hypothetical protein